ncbi:hypothetical protein F5I97DRAFT_1830164 [Phlebopus sp. FC_14]|nr:hypothetical protein F5I97DRAFT_1830164 [Phlebopus sp. FC_14]
MSSLVSTGGLKAKSPPLPSECLREEEAWRWSLRCDPPHLEPWTWYLHAMRFTPVAAAFGFIAIVAAYPSTHDETILQHGDKECLVRAEQSKEHVGHLARIADRKDWAWTEHFARLR